MILVEEQQIIHRISKRGSMSLKIIQGILKNKFQNLNNLSPKVKGIMPSKNRII